MNATTSSRARGLLAGPLAAALVVLGAGGALVAHVFSPNRSETSYSFLDPSVPVVPSAEPSLPPPPLPTLDSNPTVATPMPAPTPTQAQNRPDDRAHKGDDGRAESAGSDDGAKDEESHADDSHSDDDHGDDDHGEPTSD